ncbi:MAG: tetratricopeptide repeat protein [Planctomycetota bacterium]
MSKQANSWAPRLIVSAALLVGAVTLSIVGCSDRSDRPQSTAGVAKRRSSNADFLISTVSDSLNSLPREIVLDLTPPKPILDDAKSADGQPVLATCNVTPAVPEGPFNFIAVPKGNANFRKIGVRPGDVVRFFAKFDQDSFEHGYEQTGFFELVVRRLDQFNPENALIVENPLNGPVPIPRRIEVWRFSDKRMNEIRQRITRYWQRPTKLIGWEPSADETALDQLVERTNQWLRNLGDQETSWTVEPKISQLPKQVRAAKQIQTLLNEQNLEFGQFNATEARQLQQAVWFRDIARWAKGDAVSPVDVAAALCDWTIRNVQLEADEAASGHIHQPWQVLMYGRGTAQQRAWVFAELCRQQQLDVVMLATEREWWLPALVEEGQLYLFDMRLGLPIPGSSSESIATLAEVVEEPTLLSQLDIDGETYPVTAGDLKAVTAWLVASPLQLSKRARRLEQSLEGDDYVVLSSDTVRLGELVGSFRQLQDVQLWPHPFESIIAEATMDERQRVRAMQRFIVFAQRPRLWKARVLHFQGTKDIPLEDRNDPLAQPDYGHKQAIALYQDPRVRPPNAQIQRLEPAKRPLYQISKGDASYWLGLLSYDLGRYRVAKDWLEKRTLEARPDGPWTAGARYNLARTYEAMGDLATAIKLLEESDSPQRIGNLLRVRQLKTKLDDNASPAEE